MTTIPELLITSNQSNYLSLIAESHASKQQLFVTTAEEGTPVRIDLKPKQRKRLQSIFLDDQGFPDQSDNYNHVLHNIDGGPILRKLKHPVPDLNAPVDPKFYSEFIPETHDAQMHQEVDLSHLDPNIQENKYSLIR